METKHPDPRGERAGNRRSSDVVDRMKEGASSPVNKRRDKGGGGK